MYETGVTVGVCVSPLILQGATETQLLLTYTNELRTRKKFRLLEAATT